jgi:hypothetical protein
MAEDNKEELGRYLNDLTKDADLTQNQRRAAHEDTCFINVDGAQYDGLRNINTERALMEFDLTSDYVQRFVGEWNENRVGVEFKPDDEATSDDDANLLNGIQRADFRDSFGKAAIDNAVLEAATCGFGAFMETPEFIDKSDPKNPDQRTVYGALYTAYNTVFFDSAAKAADKRDAMRVTTLDEMTKDSFEAKYPDMNPVSAFDPKWYDEYMDLSKDSIYIATRREIVIKKEWVFVYNNLGGDVKVFSETKHKEKEKEIKADENLSLQHKRRIEVRTVMLTVFSGDAILEDSVRIAGEWLGIIPVYAYRAYVNGSEHYRGLVRKLKDAQRTLNVQGSQLVENAASSGQDIPVFLREQMEADEIKQLWANKNGKAYLVVDPATGLNNEIIAAGPIATVSAGNLDPNAAALMQFTQSYIQGQTGGFQQETVDQNSSGKALKALIKRQNMNTQVIMENIEMSVAFSGTVYASQASEILDSTRTVTTLGKEGNEARVKLDEVVADPETGLRTTFKNSLGGKKFRAYADVGPQYETMREQEVEEGKGLVEILSAIPGAEDLLIPAVDGLVQLFPGSAFDGVRKVARKRQILAGNIKPETEEEEALLAKAQEPKEDPQQKLIEAAAMQQEAEARSLDAGSLQKTADAQKKQAETVQIVSETQNSKIKTETDRITALTKLRQETLKNFQALTSQGQQFQ